MSAPGGFDPKALEVLGGGAAEAREEYTAPASPGNRDRSLAADDKLYNYIMEHSAEIISAVRRHGWVVKELSCLRDFFSTLPLGSMGVGSNMEGNTWPMRDAVIDRVKKLITGDRND